MFRNLVHTSHAQPRWPFRLADEHRRMEVCIHPQYAGESGTVRNLAVEIGADNYSGNMPAELARTGTAAAFTTESAEVPGHEPGNAFVGDATATNYWSVAYDGPPDIGGAADESLTIHYRATMGSLVTNGALWSWGNGAKSGGPLALCNTTTSAARFFFSGGYRATTTITAGDVVDVVFTYRREEDQNEVSVNGVPAGPQAHNFYSVFVPAQLYIGSGYNTTLQANNKLHWLRIWRNTKMTAGQMVALFERPMSVFEEYGRKTYFIEAAAPAGGFPAPAHGILLTGVGV